jgi:RNA polymerase sigma factor (sigma-70 family)
MPSHTVTNPTVADALLLTDFAKTRSDEAFHQVLERYAGLVRRTAVRTLGGEHAQVDDVVQAVFLILARKAGPLARRSNVAGWLYHTTRLVAGHAKREEIRRRKREEVAMATAQPQLLDLSVNEERVLLDDALGALGEKQRTAIIVHYLQGRTVAETAQVLGCPVETAKDRIANGLERLRSYFVRKGFTLTSLAVAGLLQEEAAAANEAGTVVLHEASASAKALALNTSVAAIAWNIPLLISVAVPALTILAALAWIGRDSREGSVTLTNSEAPMEKATSNMRLGPSIRVTQPYSMRTRHYRSSGADELDGNQAWALMRSCALGDGENVDALIAENPRLIQAQYWYQFPLHFAVREGHLEIVRTLLAAGSEPGQSYFMYDSWPDLLATAEERGHREVHALLCETLKRRFGYDPGFADLVAAFKSEDGGAIDRVMQDRPELARASDAYGNNAIHWAVLTNQPDLIGRLHVLGADIDGQRADGRTPLHLVFDGDYHFREFKKNTTQPDLAEIVEKLLASGADYPLTIAAVRGDRARVDQILATDPEAAKRLDSARKNPLTAAASGGDVGIVRLLLEHGGDPTMAEEAAPRGHALWVAAANNHRDIAKLLLEHGANPNAEVDSSGTAFFIIRYKNGDGPETEAMEALFRIYGGRRPLYQMDPQELRATLLDKAAFDLYRNGQSTGQWTDWDLAQAIEKVDCEFMRTLLVEQPSFLECLQGRTIQTRDAEMIRLLLAAGLDADQPDWLGKTMLHHYAGQGDLAIVTLLLENGADINVIEMEDYATPLAAAARAGKVEMVRFLLQQGARIDLPLSHLWAQPLTRAEKSGHAQVAAVLRAHSAGESIEQQTPSTSDF